MNRTVTVPASKIAVLDEVDVVVCGGGPSGFVAAIAAARQGARPLRRRKANAREGPADSGE